MSVLWARPHPAWLAWMGLAAVVGVAAALAPIMPLGAGLVLVALLLAVLVEPGLALVLMLGLAPLKTLLETESALRLPVDVGQLSLGLVIISWLTWRSTRQRFTLLPRTPLYLPLLGIMLAFGLSLFAAWSADFWLSEYLKWVEILLLVIIVLDLGQERWTWIAAGIVLAAALQAMIGLYEFQGGSGAPHLWLANYRNFRAFGTFGQPNPFSAFMGLSLPLALGMGWGYAAVAYAGWKQGAACANAWLKPGLQTLAYAGLSLLLLAGLVASWGRGAWLGFGAAAAVMVVFSPRKRWLGLALLVAAGGLALMFWLTGYLPAGVQERINSALTEFVGFGDMRAVPVNDDNFAIVERLAHWQAAAAMASAHPVLGVGLGNYEIAYPAYGIPSWPRALGHAHNDYLNVLAETGLVGLAAYLVGWGTIIYLTIRALRVRDAVMRGLMLGLLGSWAHLAVHSVVDKLYVNNLFLVIGVMLGLLAVAYRQYRLSAGDRIYGSAG